jgi:hypothetical protein
MRRRVPWPLAPLAFMLAWGLACGSGPNAGGAGHTTTPWPHPQEEGDKLVLPVAFLDGTTVELVYAPALRLERHTMQPSGELYEGTPDLKLGDLETSFLVTRTDRPVLAEPAETYPDGAGGVVRRWAAVQESQEVLRFGPWLVDLTPYLDRPLTDKELAALTEHLVGYETASGWLALRGTGPVRTWNLGEDPPETELFFDDLTVTTGCIDVGGAHVSERNGLLVQRIPEGAALGVDFVSWCDRDRRFTVSVEGLERAERLMDGLTFRNAGTVPIEPMTTYHSDEHEFSITHPSSWNRAEQSLTPLLSDPLEIFSVGTQELRPGGELCAHMPDNALADMGPADAFVTIQEEQELHDEGETYPPRPLHFGDTEDFDLDHGAGVECVPPHLQAGWMNFEDGGRAFYVLAVAGPDASEQTVDQIWAVLDSLEAKDAAP